jgi:hypothetical protein
MGRVARVSGGVRSTEGIRDGRRPLCASCIRAHNDSLLIVVYVLGDIVLQEGFGIEIVHGNIEKPYIPISRSTEAREIQ